MVVYPPIAYEIEPDAIACPNQRFGVII